MNKILVSPENTKTIRAVLLSEVPDATLWVFGSRATGNGLRSGSDLDIYIDTKIPMSLETRGNILERLSNSEIPFQVDLISSHDPIPDTLRQLIHTHRQPLE